MADEKKESAKEKKGPDQKELTVSKDASIDWPVEVEATEADPYHVTGDRFKAGHKKAKELEARGWVKIIGKIPSVAGMIVLLLMASFGSFGQASVISPMYNAKNTYTLANLVAATTTRDTVTDAGSGALYSKRIAGPGTVTIQVNQTKVSGTIAGTLTLYGSLDGVSFNPVNTEESQTALATKTLTNASGVTSYHWRLKNSPFLYYQIGASGGTTCVYYLDAYILKH